MDPHLHGQQPDAFDERERLFSGQRGRGGVLRTSQAGVLPQEKLRGCFDGRVHRHAERLHGLVPGQADQDRVRHEHHGPAAQARPRGIIRRQEQGSPTKRHHPPSEHLYSITHRPSRDLISCCSDMGIVTALSFPGAGSNRPHGCVYGLRPGNPTGRANPRLQRYRRTDCPAENQLYINRKTP